MSKVMSAIKRPYFKAIVLTVIVAAFLTAAKLLGRSIG